MFMELKDIEKLILDKLPETCRVSSVAFEGPEIVIYSKNPEAFFNSKENLVAKVAYELKKKINIRADKTLLTDPVDAKKTIEKVVPEGAGVKNITFVDPFSQVVIEALKPGLVIGKGGETSKKIILETGWTPKIIRAPTSDSELLTGIRYHLSKHASERKKFLQETAKRIYRNIEPKHDWVRLTGLGAFREIGRSCMLVDTPTTKVMMDCGINPDGNKDPYPHLEALNFPLTELDALVISHAHMDHQGFAPYLYRMGYRGPLYCTEPTRDLMALLQFDYIGLMEKDGKEPPYTEKDVKEQLKHVITRDYREVTDIAPDVRLTFHNAAHILGSASVHLHIGDGAHNLVYSSDMKYGFTRLFNPLDMRYPRIETLILESTYSGEGDIMIPRDKEEKKLLQIIRDTMKNNGNVLVPVFAIGRAQEVTLVIEDFYRKGLLPKDAKVYIDGMTKEASAIHTAYPEYLRMNVQRRILQNDSPFTSPLFANASYKERDEILGKGNAIIVASSGMLSGGASLDYFHRMAEDSNNAMVFTGYQGEGSLGRKLQAGIRKVAVSDEKGKAKELDIKMSIDSLEGFSGHSDRNQLVSFLRNLNPKPKRVIVDHGNKIKTVSFAKFISQKFGISSTAIRNLDTIRLR
jgi:KH/beta-lactamase-domain protein